jgi:hypothetical protein
MPVCETGDLIIGEVHAAAATASSAASPIEGLCRLGYGCERRKAGTGAYILGVAMKIPLWMSRRVSESLAGPPTKSYPTH